MRDRVTEYRHNRHKRNVRRFLIGKDKDCPPCTCKNCTRKK